MDSRGEKTLQAAFVGVLLFAIAGCNSEPRLPSAQADAVSKLEAVGGKVKARDGKVI